MHNTLVYAEGFFSLSFIDNNVIVMVWVVAEDKNRSKYSVKVPHTATPTDIIAETIRRRSRLMNMTPEHIQRCIEEYSHAYMLKVCGMDQFLLAECAISQYKVRIGSRTLLNASKKQVDPSE